MKKALAIITFLLIVTSTFSQSDKKDKEIVKDSKDAKAQFLKQDPSMASFFSKAHGYVIFPNVGKGGLGIGGASGNGSVYQGGKLIGMARMTQVTIGLQAGGQGYREVVFFEKAENLQRFKENDLEFTAQVSAVAATAGASANAKYTDGVAVFTMAKGGLMYEASVGGQKFKYEALK